MIFWQAGLGLIVLEIFTFGFVIGKIGFFKTLLLWIVSAMLGGWLVREQGFAALIRAQVSFDRGTVPVDDLFDSLCLLMAGALFILPGFVSDIFAFMLLIPWIRCQLRTRVPRALGLKEEVFQPREDGIIDGEYVRVEETIDIIEQRKTPTD